MCGDEVECLRARLCRIGGSVGTAGELGTSSVVRIIRSDELVLRLSWLGFRFMAGILGLMKDGDEGSDTSDELFVVVLPNGGWIDRPFMLRGRRGDGEVMGRSKLGSSAPFTGAMDGRPPKVVAGKDERGIRLMGESGDDEGDGSDSGDESVVERVVVGEESADSEACVEVLSWCLWAESDVRVTGRRC
jgi:hypothetical protein